MRFKVKTLCGLTSRKHLGFAIRVVAYERSTVESIERFLLECRKNKTKVITLANHKKTQTIQ